MLPGAYITAVDMTEVTAKLDRMGEPGMAFAADLVSAGLTIVPLGWSQVSRVSSIVASEAAAASRRRLSLGDLCCLANGIEQEMEVWTADREWALLNLPAPVSVIRAN